MMPGVEHRVDECLPLDVSPPCRDIRSRAATPATVYPRPQPFRDCDLCPSMVWIPGEDFAIGQYEVTIAQWNAYVYAGGDGARVEGEGTLPVANIYNIPQSYLDWLSQRSGHRYRLPTSQEWALAAFPGGRVQNHYWGNEAPVCEPRARAGVAFNRCGLSGPLPVGSFQPNAYGLYDVLGNVAEIADDTEREGAGDAFGFVGGSWRSPEADLGGRIGPYAEGGEEKGFRVLRER